jgi:hypothetical protein
MSMRKKGRLPNLRRMVHLLTERAKAKLRELDSRTCHLSD